MYCNPCYKWTPSDNNREIDSPVYCNPWSGWTTSYTEKMIQLCIATLHLTEQLDTTEKMIHLCIAPPWYDWRTSQYNTSEVSVPVCCLPLFPRSHCRSVSASRWPSRRSLHLGWQTNWWRQDSLKETDQKKAIFIKRYFHLKKTNRRKR